MRDVLIRRQREAVRQANKRRRGVLVGAATLLGHALLLLVLPGFAVQAEHPPILLIELKQTAPVLPPGPPATAPEYAPEPQGLRAGILSPDSVAGQGQSGPKPAAKPGAPAKTNAKSKTPAAPVKPAAKPIAAPAKPGPVKDAAPPLPKPRKDAPRVEPSGPAVPAKQNPVQPKADPPQPQLKPGDGSGGGGKPAEGGANPGGGNGDGGKPGGGSGGPPSDDPPGPGGKPGPPGAPDAGPAAPGGAPVKPAPPPAPAGPSQAVLDILADYGSKALKRIKSQARNSEQGVRGTVVFEFEVSSKGYLLDVRVVKSSGHSNLDNDVLEAARAAFNEKHEIIRFPAEVDLDKWVFKKSIDYPLY